MEEHTLLRDVVAAVEGISPLTSQRHRELVNEVRSLIATQRLD
jgi:hypothetical protein